MAKAPTRKPELTLASIATNSQKISELATGLSERIALFERWLGELPGRVDVIVWANGGVPEDVTELGLRFARAGKIWVLYFGYETPGEDTVDWGVLRDAGLDVKIQAVELFPRLLEAIDAKQAQLAKRLEETNRNYDLFASKLEATQSEGA